MTRDKLYRLDETLGKTLKGRAPCLDCWIFKDSLPALIIQQASCTCNI